MRGPDRAPRLVAIGLDACDPDLLLRWAAEGRMPFLAGLLERGASARLASTLGLFGDSPWPTANAGVSPAKHAFYQHLQLERGTYEIVRIDATRCRVPPFWHHLAGSGLRVVAFDVPKTFPVPGVEGVQICGWGEHYPLLPRPASEPAGAIDEIVDRFGAYPHPREIIEPWGRWQERRIRRMLVRNLEHKTAAVERLLVEREWDLFMAVFSEAHYAGHQFHHHWDERHWAHEPDAPRDLKDVLPDIHARLDASLERVFRLVPGDAAWFVYTVHGLSANFSGNAMMHEVMCRLGYTVEPAASEPGTRLGRWLERTRRLRGLIPDRAREAINAYLIPQEVHDRAHSAAFRASIDWERTRAFFFESDHFQAFVSLNLAGREPEGVVSPGPEADRLCEAIADDLRRLVNPATGRSAVLDVVRVADVYDGPCLSELPELVVQWAEEAPIERLEHPRFGVVSAEGFPVRRAQHAWDGLLIAGGPPIDASAVLAEPSTADLAPTFLRLLGRPVPGSMDGRVLEELLAPGSRGAGAVADREHAR